MVTGAASGIGAETARLFAAEGAHVVGVDLSEGSEGEMAIVADVTDPEQVEGMRRSPFWAENEVLAPTLRYDHPKIMGPTASVPTKKLSGIAVPVLALCGGESMQFMRVTARTIAQAVPHGKVITIEGQAHAVEPAALAPELIRFFGTEDEATRAA